MKKTITLLMLLMLSVSTLFAARTPIKGTRVASLDRMYQFVVTKKSYTAAEKAEIKQIATAFVNLGDKYGIRGDIALCQSIIETGWFKYTGGTAVTPDQHNYCGLGVTKLGKKGASFDTVEEGVEAQLQHLWAYCCKDPLPSWATCVDPRFGYVSRGRCITWEGLSGDWSTASNYGYLIMDMYADMMAFSMPNPSLTASPASVTLSGVQGGAKPTASVKVSGTEISTALKYNSSSSAFTVTTGSDWNSMSGGTLIITLDTSKSAGSYSGYVAVTSGSDQRIEIQCSGTITGNGSTTPDPTPDPDVDDSVVSGTLGNSNLNANVTSFTLKGVYGSSEMSYVDVKITGSGLSSAITVSSASSAVIVTKQSDWNDLTGGTLRMELNTNFTLGTGSRESYVAVVSGSNRIEIPFKTILTEADGTVTPEPEPDDTPVVDSYVVEGTLASTSGKLSANVTSFTLTGIYKSSDVKYVDIKITGSGLSSDIKYNSVSNVVIVEPQSDWNAKTGGTLRMTLNTNASGGAKAYTGTGYYVAVQSGGNENRIQIPFTANLNEVEDETETPDPTPDPEPQTGNFIVSGTLGDDYLSTNATSFTLTGVQGSSEVSYVDIKITGSGLTKDITYNSASSAVKVEPQSDWNARTGGTLRMTLNNAFSVGTHSYNGENYYYVAVQSTENHRIKIPFTAIIKEGTGTTDPTPDPTPDPEPEQGNFIVEGTLGDDYLSANATSFTLTGVLGSTEKPYVDVKITGNNLSDDISINPKSSVIEWSTLDDWNMLTGGTLRLTLNTNFVLGAGTYTGTDYFVAVQSESHRIQIPFTAILTEGTVGVDDVEINNDVPAIWYNLQGVVVDGENLAAGVYICRQGDSIKKVLVK